MPSLVKALPLILVFLAPVLLTSFRSDAESPPAEFGTGLSTAWMREPLWDDGNAEYAVYDAKWRRYGRLNQGRVCILMVKEPWQDDKDVKAERAEDADFDVLKLNMIRDVDTGVYTYEQMASVFAKRSTGALRKYVTGSLEACGQTSTMMAKGELSTRSYWGDQGNQSQRWQESVIPEDALPMYLRGLVAGELPSTIKVFPSLMAGRLPLLQAAEFSLKRKENVPVQTAAGSFATVQLELSFGVESMTYQFDAKGKGHTLVRYHNSNGTEYTLAKVERMPYWHMNGVKDRGWWPKRLR